MTKLVVLIMVLFVSCSVSKDTIIKKESEANRAYRQNIDRRFNLLETKIDNKLSELNGKIDLLYELKDDADKTLFETTEYNPTKQIISIYFDYNRANIKSQYHEHIAHIANLMRNDTLQSITIESYSDARGTVKYNQDLANQRVESILNELQQIYGINKENFTDIKIKGKDELLSRYDFINRRVDFIFTAE